MVGRGGPRKNAGRKSTWKSGRRVEETTIIRVPKEFSGQLLEIARKLDAGEVIEFATNSEYDTVTQSNEEKVSVLDLVTNSIEDANFKSQSLIESVTNSKTNDENEVKPKDNSVTESERFLNQIKGFAQKWTILAEKASLKNGQWIKARLMIREINELIEEIRGFSNLVTETKNDLVLVTESKNDLVTKTNIVETNQLNLLERKNLEPLTITALAARFKVHHTTVSRYISGQHKLTFEQWSKMKDPDGVGWVYSQDLQKCVPLL